MSTPNGYNNPAYCHQYDSFIYDYQYVPEIDPDSPDLEESNRKIQQTKLIHSSCAKFPRESSESSEFEGSDESNRSIIVEECNNRRVTLICEKRSKMEVSQDDPYEDGNFDGAYYHDISLESENGNENQKISKGFYDGREKNKKSLRHQKILQPSEGQPVRILSSSNNNTNDSQTSCNQSSRQLMASKHGCQMPQRYHRYEEISHDEDCIKNEPKPPLFVHRYAEITTDENGYPTLSKEIKIEQNRDCYRQKEVQSQRVISKPRAISPINYSNSFSAPQTPSRSHQKIPKEFEFSVSRFSPNSSSPIIYSSSPIKTNSFEMAELSPPRATFSQPSFRQSNDNTFFINSPKRQPPIGASIAGDLKESYTSNEKRILPKNLQQNSIKRCQSLPKSPRKRKNFSGVEVSPQQIQTNKKISQIFHNKPCQPQHKADSRGASQNGSTPVRRNISNYFPGQPADYFRAQEVARNPYKPTTTEINPPKTAVITPIFQRKNQPTLENYGESLSPKRNFEKMSQAFQSTGNIFKSTKETGVYTNDVGFLSGPTQQKVRIKRNQSVPNFSQTFASEARGFVRKAQDMCDQGHEKYSRNLNFQYSPKKPAEHVSVIDKSRISLIDQTSSWSNLDSDYHPQCSTCFIFAALVHIVTASATCAISFYLLSKVGRRYYLDFGLLAGFMNFILGLLGFRSYCWKWLPNRNYVSGFIGLAAFSALTCAGLTYLITARPMAGDPILDILGGAICAVSVLTIVLALTGLTMSGCCKAPPPDNRVNDI